MYTTHWYVVMVKYSRFGEPKNFTFETLGGTMGEVAEKVAAKLEGKQYAHFSNETLGVAIPVANIAEIQVHRRNK